MDAFLEAGLVRPVNIEDNEVRYDIVTEEHGHLNVIPAAASTTSTSI
jgi:Fe2+ or Zn2+ uptake regulation protein